MDNQTVVPLFDPHNFKRVHQRIKKLWDEGNVQFLFHAEKRIKRRKWDSNDIKHIIKYGRIVDHSKPGELWRYKIQGKSVDGINLSCVVEINGILIIITVIGNR